MPVDEIKSTTTVLPTVSPSRDRVPASPATTSASNASNPVPAAVSAAQGLTSSQQSALLVNETLLNFTPSSSVDSLLFNEANPNITTVLESQNLSLSQQAALAFNDTLQTLNFVPSSPVDPLLLNETNPNLTTVLESQGLSLAQQAALAVNETLQTMTTSQVEQESKIAAATAGNVAQNLTASPLGTTLINATVAGVATIAGTSALNLTASAVAPTQITTPATETTATSAVLSPTPSVVTQPILDRNPIAVSVYEIRDQKPAPPDPKPRRKEVLPPPPIGRVRRVDPLVLRREWERRKESGRRHEVLPRPPLEERSIREMVSQVNEDLAANGLPLRLVLAKNNEGYSLDIYDCSDDAVCRLAQEIPLDLNELLTILDNLQHETGIIVNIKT